jgi:hypothetical protein
MSPAHDESAACGWKEYRGNEPIRALLVVTKDRSYVPSWAHYLTAEGDANEISIHFVTCIVRVKGTGLDLLLRKLIFQRITELFVPKRADRFRQSDDAPGITELSVELKRKAAHD